MAPDLAVLHASLVQRLRPEDVAGLGFRLLPDAPGRVRAALHNLSQASASPFSSMSVEFEAPVDCSKQVGTLSRMLSDFDLVAPSCDPSSPASVRAFLAEAGTQVGWVPGADLRAYKAATSPLSPHRTLKVWRSLSSLQEKVATFEAALRLRRATLVGRSAFALEVDVEAFSADPLTAVTVAYLVARRNLRREFTLNARQGTTDEVLDVLLSACEESPSTRWDVLALVRPTPKVLSRLATSERAGLLGRWSVELRMAAAMLGEVAERSPLDWEWMVVSRGVDSSTWNAAARWYNTSRDNFFALLTACGLREAFEAFCPPKAVRLMAADLVRYHQFSGGQAHPDTRVAARLPRPWEVVSGEASLSAETVRAACKEEGVDPVESGWAALRAPRDVEEPAPTRELVHGVAVSDPLLAEVLRRARAWAGPSKGGLRPGYVKVLDEVSALLD